MLKPAKIFGELRDMRYVKDAELQIHVIDLNRK